MREVLFRGKRLDDGKWIEGGITFSLDQEYIFIAPERFSDYDDEICIDKNTLGQFTGLTDKNGKKIFEGDLVYYNNFNHDEEDGAMQVVFENGEFAIEGYGLYVQLSETYKWELEVIGNIYDNPELLED